jgi:hypothetical protein
MGYAETRDPVTIRVIYDSEKPGHFDLAEELSRRPGVTILDAQKGTISIRIVPILRETDLRRSKEVMQHSLKAVSR